MSIPLLIMSSGFLKAMGVSRVFKAKSFVFTVCIFWVSALILHREQGPQNVHKGHCATRWTTAGRERSLWGPLIWCPAHLHIFKQAFSQPPVVIPLPLGSNVHSQKWSAVSTLDLTQG